MTTRTTGRSTTHASGSTFPVGQRAARSLPERWPAAPLLVLNVWRLKAIDARRKGEACGLPLSLSAVRLWQEKTPAGLPTAGVLLSSGVGGVRPDALSLPADG